MCASGAGRRRLWQLLPGGGLGLGEELLDIGRGEVAAVGEDGGDFLGVGDVGEGIGAEENEVGEFAGLDGAGGGFDAEELGGIERGSLQGFEWREAGGDEALQLFVEAEAG